MHDVLRWSCLMYRSCLTHRPGLRRPAVSGTCAARIVAGVLVGMAVAGCQAPWSADRSISSPRSVQATTRYPLGPAGYRMSVRGPALTFTGRTLDARPFSVAGLRGHVVVVNVWASWCEPCQAESPALVSVAKATSSRGVLFIGIDEHDQSDAAKSFLKKVGSSYPQLLDPDGALLDALSPWLPPAVPGTVILDRSGRVAARIIGPASAAQVTGLISTALAEP